MMHPGKVWECGRWGGMGVENCIVPTKARRFERTDHTFDNVKKQRARRLWKTPGTHALPDLRLTTAGYNRISRASHVSALVTDLGRAELQRSSRIEHGNDRVTHIDLPLLDGECSTRRRVGQRALDRFEASGQVLRSGGLGGGSRQRARDQQQEQRQWVLHAVQRKAWVFMAFSSILSGLMV